MKKFLLILLVPLVVSAVAIAAPSPASASAHCKNLKRQAPALFAPTSGAMYADLTACVTAKTAAASQNTKNAAKACDAERTANPTKFATDYAAGNGKSKNDKANMGACVSAKAKAAEATQQAADVTAAKNAAKQCKKERADANFATGHGGKTFAQFYGTNKNGKNAFGKCVSKLAKAQHG